MNVTLSKKHYRKMWNSRWDVRHTEIEKNKIESGQRNLLGTRSRWNELKNLSVHKDNIKKLEKKNLTLPTRWIRTMRNIQHMRTSQKWRGFPPSIRTVPVTKMIIACGLWLGCTSILLTSCWTFPTPESFWTIASLPMCCCPSKVSIELGDCKE